ncbi:MAG: putative rane protein [Chloroflexi bacterium]|jgi:Family of unknown function (DUF6159)|nr:putative rane protein [Chloroflexota bacterium]
MVQAMAAPPGGRWSRGLRLARASWSVLRANPALGLLPVLSFAGLVLYLLPLLGIAAGMGAFEPSQRPVACVLAAWYCLGASFVGRLVSAIVGIAWGVATAFAVPVLVLEDVSAVESIRRSMQILRRSWGESLVGNAAITLPLLATGVEARPRVAAVGGGNPTRPSAGGR